MKKMTKYFKIISFCCLFVFFLCGFFFNKNTKSLNIFKVNAFQNEKYVFEINSLKSQTINDSTFSSLRKVNINKEIKEKIDFYNKLLKMGFREEQAVKYLFPDVYEVVEKTAKRVEKCAKDAVIKIVDNSCKILIEPEEDGVKMDKNALYSKILYNKLNKNEKNLIIQTTKIIPKESCVDLMAKTVKRGEFKTYFGSSKEERKENIKLAIKTIDGTVLKPGEEFSFNNKTGERSEKNGYKKANVISGGIYIESTGGGVCQVSTTLYNACLRAGLEITEIHPHSLSVGYVDPGFDAMVNMGSSDFRFKNSTDEDVIITASCVDDYCRFVIYGKPMPYTIKTRSVVLEEIEPSIVFTEDIDKYGKDGRVYSNNETMVFPKKGIKAEGYIDIYNKDGILTVTRRERKVTYKPINQVVFSSKKS